MELLDQMMALEDEKEQIEHQAEVNAANQAKVLLGFCNAVLAAMDSFEGEEGYGTRSLADLRRSAKDAKWTLETAESSSFDYKIEISVHRLEDSSSDEFTKIWVYEGEECTAVIEAYDYDLKYLGLL